MKKRVLGLLILGMGLMVSLFSHAAEVEVKMLT